MRRRPLRQRELFKDMLDRQGHPRVGDKDFAVNIQNIILAFAGRVLLRKADIRFERGYRYGLIGQNAGKTMPSTCWRPRTSPPST